MKLLLWCLMVSIVALSLFSVPAHAKFVGLGEAGEYALFDVSNSGWSMNNSVILGPMAAGPGTTFNWSGGSGPYSGPIYYPTGGVVPPVNKLGGTPKPTAIATDLTQAVLDARTAAASAAGLTANLTVPGNQITNTTGTITGLGHGAENVVDLTQVNMTNGHVLIGGHSDEWFIFRVSGNFSVGNSTIRVTGGLTPDHVLWYFPNTSTIKSPNGAWDGTILALNSGVSFDNTPDDLGPVNGAIIAADDMNNAKGWEFKIVSGFDLNYSPYEPEQPQSVREPAGLFLLGFGLLGLIGFRKKFESK